MQCNDTVTLQVAKDSTFRTSAEGETQSMLSLIDDCNKRSELSVMLMIKSRRRRADNNLMIGEQHNSTNTAPVVWHIIIFIKHMLERFGGWPVGGYIAQPSLAHLPVWNVSLSFTIQ